MAPVVSVIIPCFQQARFLPVAVNSVLEQTMPDFECIIINDGSTDDTRRAALSLAAGDQRVRYVEQDNRGLSGARNRGLQEAKGDFIQFLDADDLLHPAKLQLQLDALRPEPGLALSICDYYVCDADDVYKRVPTGHDFEHPRLRDPNPLLDLARRWEVDLSIPIHCFLFDARLFRESNIWFDDSLPNHEDWDCWMCIFRLGPRIAHVARELAVYRRHAGSMTRDRLAMRDGYTLAIRKQLRSSENDRAIRKALKQKLKQIRVAYLGKPTNPFESARRLYGSIIPWPIQTFLRNLVSRAEE